MSDLKIDTADKRVPRVGVFTSDHTSVKTLSTSLSLIKSSDDVQIDVKWGLAWKRIHHDKVMLYRSEDNVWFYRFYIRGH